MAAIEYGSSYWGVILNGLEPNVPGETVYLHADGMKIDGSGALTFISAGKRPAGAWPEQPQKGGEGKSAAAGNGNGDAKAGGKDDGIAAKDEHGKDGGKGGDGKGGDSSEKSGTIYMAFAPGTWRTVFAALLSDGSPAPVEHWTAFGGKPMLETILSPNAAAKMG
ncbi:MAG TPA: hypothetical protein VGD60_02185 [Candidatus Acidoferrales bacterium]